MKTEQPLSQRQFRNKMEDDLGQTLGGLFNTADYLQEILNHFQEILNRLSDGLDDLNDDLSSQPEAAKPGQPTHAITYPQSGEAAANHAAGLRERIEQQRKQEESGGSNA